MWQARPVFISSTFADMQAERDHLRRVVFPALAERLQARRRHLEWVDLRLGVATAALEDGQRRELQVLKVCLAEIRRCRPFLIVLLGDRYGWVPPAELITVVAGEEGFDSEIAGRSVTDLEISFGILRDPEQEPRSFFYFRDPLPYAAMPPVLAAQYSDAHDPDPGAADRGKRLANLKSEIETRLPGRVRHYNVDWDRERQSVSGLDNWGQAVIEDIWSDLAAETASAEAELDVSWQQIERRALDDYIEDRARGFVGRGQILSRLNAFATSVAQEAAPWGVCLIGAPGSGKSALFGELNRRLKHSDIFILAHAAGASPRAPSVDAMLRRWIDELAIALDCTADLVEDADLETVQATLSTLLVRMSPQRRVILLVDGLDQFETTIRGRFATWLPQLISANVRAIATAIAGDASNALSERAGFDLIDLPPLDLSEARSIIASICARYHRTFEPEVFEGLLAKRATDGAAWENPLWLVLAVEELNLLDADDFARLGRSYRGAPAERLRALMVDIIAVLPADIPGLYGATFERAAEQFGTVLAQSFLSLIGVSRSGWRESDFRVLLPILTAEPWDPLRFASLRRLFRGQLRQGGELAQWDFAHAQMRVAVRTCLSAWGVAETDLHAAISDYLLSMRSDDPLHLSETMIHLLSSKNWTQCARYYGDWQLSRAEMQGATRALADTVLTSLDQSSATSTLCRLLDAPEIDMNTRACAAQRFAFELSRSLEVSATTEARFVIVDRARHTLEQLAPLKPDDVELQRCLQASFDGVGNVQMVQRNLAGALKSYGNALAIAERCAKLEPHNAQCRRDLLVSHSKLGDLQIQQWNYVGALKSYGDALAIADRLAKSDPHNTNWQRDLSLLYCSVGGVQFKQGDLVGALKSHGDALAIVERLGKSDPSNAVWQRDLSVFYCSVGNVQFQQGDLAGALKSYGNALAIAERLAKSDPSNAVWQGDPSVLYRRFGDVQFQQGDLAGALKSYGNALAIAERLTKSDPRNAGWQVDLAFSNEQIGNVQRAQGDVTAAFKSYEAKRDIISRLAKSDPDNPLQHELLVSCNKVGDMQFRQDDLAGALKSYGDALAIAERLAKSDSSNALWQHDLLESYSKVGGVQVTKGDLAGAMVSYGHILAIRDRLAKSDPSNGLRQRDLSISFDNIGDLQAQQGDLAGALKSYGDALAIAERLTKSDPRNTLSQSDLAASYLKVGDLQFAYGDLAAALTSYEHGLAIQERLAMSDPSNTGWQREWSVSWAKIAIAASKAGDNVKALAALRNGQAIMGRVTSRSPNNAVWNRDLAWFNGQIEKLSR
jgi:tetratricopeptide (TPR) repeat protein